MRVPVVIHISEDDNEQSVSQSRKRPVVGSPTDVSCGAKIVKGLSNCWSTIMGGSNGIDSATMVNSNAESKKRKRKKLTELF